MRLSRERWHSAGGLHNKRKESPGFRKITALVVLLVLIVVCMRQLSDPERIAPVLESIGLVPQSLNDQNLATVLAATDSKLLLSNETARTLLILSSVWRDSIAELPADRLRALSTLCFQQHLPNASPAVTEPTTFLTEFYQKVEQRLTDRAQTLPPDEAANTFSTLWRSFRETSADQLPEGLLSKSLQAAIDRRLLDSFKDDASWDSEESFPLAWALQTGGRIQTLIDESTETPAGSAVIEAAQQQFPLITLPLMMTKTEPLRGRLVRTRGKVLRLDSSIVIKRSNLGDHAYREVWIKPEYSGNTLACLYYPTGLGDSIDLAADSETSIEFTAIPIKRLAYISDAGTSTAPILIAVAHRKLSPAPIAASTTTEVDAAITSIANIDLNLLLSVD